MKRILCVLFIAFFTVTLGLAQELKFDGYINSGLGLVITDQDDDAALRVFGVDSEQQGGRFRLNGAYTNASKNAGANFRLQLQGNNSSAGFGPSFVYGWIKPLDMLQIKAGIVDDSTWETAGQILKDDQGEGAGVLFRLTPINGLDIGFGAYVWAQSSGGNNNVFASPGIVQNWWDAKYTFMISYIMPDMFKINLNGRTYNNANNTTSARAIAEFRLLMVENLTAVAEAELDGLWTPADEYDAFGNTGSFNIFETVAYKMGGLNFGLNAAQYISNDDTKEDAGLRFSPWVSYSLNEGKLVPRLDLTYFLAGRKRTDGRYDRRTEFESVYNKDAYVFSVRPSIKFNPDSRNSFEIGDGFYYQKPASGDGVITNVFYLDFIFRF